MPFAATWMDLDIMVLSKEKDKHHISLIIGILKNKTNELIYKTNLWLPKGEAGEGGIN